MALFDEEITTPGTDLDLYLTVGAAIAASSGGPTSNEVITVRNTGAAPLAVTAQSTGSRRNGPSATGTLFDWVVDTSDPEHDPGGRRTGRRVVWCRRTRCRPPLSRSGTRYLARVDYDDGTTVMARTLVSVNP